MALVIDRASMVATRQLPHRYLMPLRVVRIFAEHEHGANTMPTLKVPYATNKIAHDCVTIVVPSEVPTQQRAEVLRALYNEHVKPTQAGGHWKGPCAAEVPAAIADDVAAAMDFTGSIVDDRRVLPGGTIRLFSDGYWAHGF